MVRRFYANVFNTESLGTLDDKPNKIRAISDSRIVKANLGYYKCFERPRVYPGVEAKIKGKFFYTSCSYCKPTSANLGVIFLITITISQVYIETTAEIIDLTCAIRLSERIVHIAPQYFVLLQTHTIHFVITRRLKRDL